MRHYIILDWAYNSSELQLGLTHMQFGTRHIQRCPADCIPYTCSWKYLDRPFSASLSLVELLVSLTHRTLELG